MPAYKRSIQSKQVKLTRRAFAAKCVGFTRLRVALDSLTLGAVQYYMSAKNEKERLRRLSEMERAIDSFPGLKQEGIGGRCAPGYNDCGGYCVPYDCPEDPDIM